MADEDLRVNADFGARVLLHTDEMSWVPSPEPGVERRMLDRVGGELARATSIVRYAPSSRFSVHGHELGEEFLVLEGVFSDEEGSYPASTYVRNPPGSRHTPYSDAGCVLFVKLRQFSADDSRRVVLDTRSATFAPLAKGARSLQLHVFGEERVRLLRLTRNATVPSMECPGGAELLVLGGQCVASGYACREGTWLRLPAGSVLSLESDDGALLYLKTGHLPAAD
jgi:anti-sigma factor ChrR (cupin superfamily)